MASAQEDRQAAPSPAHHWGTTVNSFDVLSRTIFGARTALEAAASPEEKVRANDRIERAMTKLEKIAADRPPIQAKPKVKQELKAKSQDVLARLSDAENRIAVERRRYNDMLEHYNAQIQRFPDNIVASVAGFSRDNAYFPTESRQ